MLRFALVLLCLFFHSAVFALAEGFVYLADVAPGIEQDIRYFTANNFVGRPIRGYQKPQCILARPAAQALLKAQKMAEKKGYRLKVYDCYRPQQAVDDFYRWSQDASAQGQKKAFYPRVAKSELFAKGYIARYSGHSRGATVDLTLVSATDRIIPPGTAIERCFDRSPAYLNDNSIDMGTRYDCLDPTAHRYSREVTAAQRQKRALLHQVMTASGFKGYAKEWWHYSLRNEPYPRRYFDFPVR
ncbi:MAG: M15 family metallopeptidase [Legionellaceae bacterium]|nr:M15 family metallopeptidase [Legionellaceae bacterium]